MDYWILQAFKKEFFASQTQVMVQILAMARIQAQWGTSTSKMFRWTAILVNIMARTQTARVMIAKRARTNDEDMYGKKHSANKRRIYSYYIKQLKNRTSFTIQDQKHLASSLSKQVHDSDIYATFAMKMFKERLLNFIK